MQLVKATSFVVDGRFYKFQSVIGSGKYVKTEETDAGSSSDKRREIGELRRDAHGLEAEASWRLANVMEVQVRSPSFSQFSITPNCPDT